MKITDQRQYLSAKTGLNFTFQKGVYQAPIKNDNNNDLQALVEAQEISLKIENDVAYVNFLKQPGKEAVEGLTTQMDALSLDTELPQPPARLPRPPKNSQLLTTEEVVEASVSTILHNSKGEIDAVKVISSEGVQTLKMFALRNYSEYHSILNLILMEMICSGDVVGVRNLVTVKQKTSITTSSNITATQTMQKIGMLASRQETNQHSFEIQVNFDLIAFSNYVKEKYKLMDESAGFLGLADQVRACLQLVVEAGSLQAQYVDKIMRSLEDKNAFTQVDALFDLTI